MKASELIEELQKHIDKYGDLPVFKSSRTGCSNELKLVDVYDKNGFSPGQPEFNTAVEFYLW